MFSIVVLHCDREKKCCVCLFNNSRKRNPLYCVVRAKIEDLVGHCVQQYIYMSVLVYHHQETGVCRMWIEIPSVRTDVCLVFSFSFFCVS